MLREPSQAAVATRPSRESAHHESAAGSPASFGQCLRTRRQQLGLSLTQLASLVHFDRGHLSKVENGKRSPSVSFAEACDRALDFGDTLTTIATALEAAARQQQGVRPAQLPAAMRTFVGRWCHLGWLADVLHGDEQSLAVPVAVISGSPGVGKTALAVQSAHQAVNDGHFRDGQLFVNLRGSDSAGAAAPFNVLVDLLRALGVPAEHIPVNLEQRAATFRSVLHGREMLLVLDDAADAQQILPLLPGSPGCAVLVTSRSRLPGLMSLVGAVTQALPELSRPEATLLIRSIIGEKRADADPRAVAVLAERCSYLPLALALASEHIMSHRHDSAGTLAADLQPEHARLGLAEGEVNLREVFGTSYTSLDKQSARMFRLLGLLPSHTINAAAAAAAAGVSQEEASLLLGRLACAHLIQHLDDRRYQWHELMRAYAAELAKQLDAEPDRTAAMHRAAAHYCTSSPQAVPLHAAESL
ncbi:helix-turn-helix domain-containing protein [Streptomyces hokutonensis]|uniref:helix-turn-helix domain-containing protein n=1 Tax=Streptomyces hokutonensis TaxID=1306990 RepID=UPI00368B8099